MGWRDKGQPSEVWGRVYFSDGSYLLRMRWRGNKSAGYGYFRHMRTTQERRHWDEEFGRLSRSPRRLPEYRDEHLRTIQKSWKEHRRTQYK